MLDQVITKIEGDRFAVYVVWEPILRTDDEQSSRKAATLFPDTRVTNYWVDTKAVGRLFQSPLRLTTEPAWDVYLVYEPGISWADSIPPTPTQFMHQLSGRLPEDQQLDGARLRSWIEALLPE